MNRVHQSVGHNKKESETILVLDSFVNVGITGLEPATSRPPDVCATNCAKSRTFTAAKVIVFIGYSKFSACFSSKEVKKEHFLLMNHSDYIDILGVMDIW